MHRSGRYEVSGLDENGDVHIFRTDRHDHAEEMRRLMLNELLDVRIAIVAAEDQPDIHSLFPLE